MNVDVNLGTVAHLFIITMCDLLISVPLSVRECVYVSVRLNT